MFWPGLLRQLDENSTSVYLTSCLTVSRLIVRRCYTAIIEDQEYSSIRPLIDWLDYNGYTVVTKATKEFIDASGRRKVKGNMDIELAVDAMELAEHVDQIVLFSGDGDFRALVEAVQRRGVLVTVISTISSQPPMIADELRRQADVFTDLVELQSKLGRDPSGRPAPREPRHHAPQFLQRATTRGPRAKTTTWMIERLALETSRRRPTTTTCCQRAPGPPRIVCRDIPSVSIARLAGVPRLRPAAFVILVRRSRTTWPPCMRGRAARNTVGSATTARAARSGYASAGAHREVDRRVRFAAGAFHLEETEAGILRVAKGRRRLRRGRRIASRDRVGLRPRRDWCLERNKTWFGSSQICLTSHAIVSRSGVA
jgi:uncharacterized LabA/DUF88 family protein